MVERMTGRIVSQQNHGERRNQARQDAKPGDSAIHGQHPSVKMFLC
jgi:hypothetical protein